jgi:DNA mismatch endonuclease, patch repair protein
MRDPQRRRKPKSARHELVTSPLRSRIMRSVPREGTTAEVRVATFLRSRGIRFRRNVRSLPGSPDLANKSRALAIYVHGCFWHRHPGCRRATVPKANASFWATKFEENVVRDRRKESALRALGYRVEVVWECQTFTEEQLANALAELLGGDDESVNGKASATRRRR